MEEVPDFSEETKRRKAAEFAKREREYEDGKNPALVLRTVVEAVRYGLPLPEWALREQARINQAILRVGEDHRDQSDLASEISKAAGLTSRGRGSAFSEDDHKTYLLFLGHLLEDRRARFLEKNGRHLSWTEVYAELAVEYEISERTLRRARKHLQVLRQQGLVGPRTSEDR